MPDPNAPAEPSTHAARAGVSFALFAYLWWGVVLPVFFAQLKAADAMELLAHRVLFGLPLLLIMLAWNKRLGELLRTLRSWKHMRVLSVTTVLIAINWYVFTYAVVTGQLLEASFGYYINPLVSMALGMVFLGERPRRLGWVAVLLALAAVVYLGLQIGLPWISITVALCFGLYGLLRKKSDAGPVLGLTVEMTIMFPVLLGMFLYLHADGRALLLVGPPSASAMMMMLGLVTVIPMLCFTAATRRLQLTTMGVLQYLTPTGQFLSAIALGEAFDQSRVVAFSLIWLALIVFTYDSVTHHRRALRRMGSVEICE
ncbi:MAG: chloramphenicol-sensitive protein RarD [Phycisphaerales bacterium]|jgi:chloramphenicol-sensitive protein RarD